MLSGPGLQSWRRCCVVLVSTDRRSPRSTNVDIIGHEVSIGLITVVGLWYELFCSTFCRHL